jgi:hypothetical protein
MTDRLEGITLSSSSSTSMKLPSSSKAICTGKILLT